jgi:hypothetical protein
MSKTEINEVETNGTVYVKKGSENIPASKVDGMDYVVIRTYSAGVFAGYLKIREGKEAQLIDARRLWYWDGAASLSQLAQEGVSKPQNCKFAMPVNVTLTEVVEILEATEKALKSIEGVEEWKV